MKHLLILIFVFQVAYGMELDAQLISGEQDLPGLSRPQQVRMLKELRRGWYAQNLSVYFLPKEHPGLKILPAQMLEMLYQMSSSGSEANCYWTSMFATGVLGLPERFMDMPEYQALLQAHFESRANTQEFFPGDVIRLKRARGNMETHSVVYLGHLRGQFYTHLVLSKNGPADGPYAILELADLQNRIYPGSVISAVYRLK